MGRAERTDTEDLRFSRAPRSEVLLATTSRAWGTVALSRRLEPLWYKAGYIEASGPDFLIMARDGTFLAVDIASGRQRWSLPYGRDSLRFAANKELVVTQSLKNVVAAIDARTGAERWKWHIGSSFERLSGARRAGKATH
jgi:outer membrane protein assembly factor BamB